LILLNNAVDVHDETHPAVPHDRRPGDPLHVLEPLSNVLDDDPLFSQKILYCLKGEAGSLKAYNLYRAKSSFP
jgi:hypothetical protein